MFTSSNTSRQDAGRLAEEFACDHLIKKGLTLITRNYRCRNGEIDLIMQHDSHIVFIEVRSRRSKRFGSAAESVDRNKQGKIIQTALHYLMTNDKMAKLPARFDVITLHPGNNNTEIQWLQDAFQA